MLPILYWWRRSNFGTVVGKITEYFRCLNLLPYLELFAKDQFIWLDDLPDFLQQVSKMFCLQGQEIDDLVTKMAIPIMEFTYGDKERGSPSRNFSNLSCNYCQMSSNNFVRFSRTLIYNLLYFAISLLRHKTSNWSCYWSKNVPNCSEQSVTRADNVFVAIFTIFRMPSIIELLCSSSRAQSR